MERTAISSESGNYVSQAYDPATQKLHVEFKGGKTYEYHDVTPEEYADLMAADSFGKHHSLHIKGVKGYRSLDDEATTA